MIFEIKTYAVASQFVSPYALVEVVEIFTPDQFSCTEIPGCGGMSSADFGNTLLASLRNGTLEGSEQDASNGKHFQHCLADRGCLKLIWMWNTIIAFIPTTVIYYYFSRVIWQFKLSVYFSILNPNAKNWITQIVSFF